MSPSAALVLLTLGLLLVYVELNRPGAILPGALGLLAALLALNAFRPYPLNTAAIIASVLVFAAILLQLRRSLPALTPWLATAILLWSLTILVRRTTPAAPHIHPAASIPCALLLGFGTSTLTRIARRARINKGLD